ncbi:TetR/AcrR family transcriptional regulator [Virgisporangium aliadipatigenens]|uniref:TetR/AcrR family transcriptional regulator n=1 Tax=Virgisporangium aliadipatigenens TaxID=741659 RepID=UPI0019446FE7|nr:TetR family transcriptional regulator [Virgisporangium aliadipatigenens]
MTQAGRRPGGSGTRAAILAAAREQFADKGYGGASLRTIAAAAGVDPGLIRHFYGSKDDLFAAALEVPEEMAELMVRALTGHPDGLGERVLRAYLAVWEDPAMAGPLLAVVRSAVTSERAAERLRTLIGARLLAEVAPHLGPDGDVRAGITAAHLMGIAVSRYVFRVEPVASLDREVLIGVCAPVIQAYLTGPLGRN